MDAYDVGQGTHFAFHLDDIAVDLELNPAPATRVRDQADYLRHQPDDEKLPDLVDSSASDSSECPTPAEAMSLYDGALPGKRRYHCVPPLI
jgi:hypothetical protein